MEIGQKTKRLYLQRLKRKVHGAMRRFFSELQRRTRGPVEFHFIPEAYYVTMGIQLLSPKAYRNWHQAYKAAKRIHKRAFFCTGRTLAKRLA